MVKMIMYIRDIFHRFVSQCLCMFANIPGAIMSDGELRETQTANYFSNIYPIDCAVLSVNA